MCSTWAAPAATAESWPDRAQDPLAAEAEERAEEAHQRREGQGPAPDPAGLGHVAPAISVRRHYQRPGRQSVARHHDDRQRHPGRGHERHLVHADPAEEGQVHDRHGHEAGARHHHGRGEPRHLGQVVVQRLAHGQAGIAIVVRW
jgi:hypothetical protein